MCIGKLLLGAILVSHLVAGGASTRTIARCSGGRSVRGVSSADELHSQVDADGRGLRTASCCDDDTSCHGGYLLAGHHLTRPANGVESIESIEPTLSRYAQRFNNNNNERVLHKRSIGEQPVETGCCSTKASVFFPISAISALTGEAVHVIQAPPAMLQAVVFARCESDKSVLLDADCTQDYVAEMMHVATIDAETKELRAYREPVLLESGCSCRLNQQSPLQVEDGPSIADTVATFLTMW